MICFCGLFLSHALAQSPVYTTLRRYMVVDLPEHLLGCYDQAHDLPYGHLEIHLGKLEQALEEARHFDFIAP
jgi:hypothetical protein